MLDDCKGPKFEELLAVFSTAVLHSALANDTLDQSISRRLLLENNSLDQKQLLPLTLAYRSALSARLDERRALERRWHKFGRVLKSKKEELDQRARSNDENVHVYKKNKIPKRTLERLKTHLNSNWTGDTHWIDLLLKSDQHLPQNNLLERPFTEVWQHACDDTLYSIRPQRNESLLQNLERRVDEQNTRLEKWKGIRARLDLQAQAMSVDNLAPSVSSRYMPDQRRLIARPIHSRSNSSNNNISEDWTDIEAELDYQKAKPRARSPQKNKAYHERAASKSTLRQNHTAVSSPLGYRLEQQDPPSNVASAVADDTFSFHHHHTRQRSTFDPPNDVAPRGPIPATEHPATLTRAAPGISPLSDEGDTYNSLHVSEIDEQFDDAGDDERLAAQILSSVMNAEPSPVKPVLSLAERTRMSMAMMSPQKTEARDQELTSSPRRSPERSHYTLPSHVNNSILETPGIRDTLAERTRQSMSLMSARPTHMRRKSTKSRPSNAYPANQFETPKRPQSMYEATEVSLLEISMQESEADYEAIFKSRPRVAVSPVLHPIASGRESIGERLDIDEH